MTWLSIVLVGLGVGDLVRSASWPRGRIVAHVVSPVTIAAVAVACGVVGWADAVALALAAAGGAVWIELSTHTQLTGRRALAPLGTFGVVMAGLIAFPAPRPRPAGHSRRGSPGQTCPAARPRAHRGCCCSPG